MDAQNTEYDGFFEVRKHMFEASAQRTISTSLLVAAQQATCILRQICCPLP